jgi:hypothetical protein
MDKSTFRHHVSVAPWDEWNFHAFVRSDDGTVEHYWPGDEGTMFGPEDLGGHFDSDPLAVWRFTQTSQELHLIGRSGLQLVDWFWHHPGTLPLPLLGQPAVLTLPGFAVADPEVVTSGGEIHVFAASLDGPMRHWSSASVEAGWSDPEVMTGDVADHLTRPCAVIRAAGSFDVFSIDNDNSGLRHWFNDADGWHSEHRSGTPVGQNLVGRPAAASYAERRLDVFALRSDGEPIHWGWDGRSRFGPEERLGSPGVLEGDLHLLTVEEEQLTFVARASDASGQPQLVTWDLDPRPPASWRGPHDIDSCPFPVTAWTDVTQEQDPATGDPVTLAHLTMLNRSADGSFTRHILVRTDEFSIDGTLQWERDGEFVLHEDEPPPPRPMTFTPATVDPDLVARRPEDLVLLGVRWNDAVEVEAGPPTELLAHAGAELTVTLPPQHVAEEVVAAEGVDPQFTGASTAGPSRVVVALDEGTRVPLTVGGVLDALRQGRLVPATDLTDEHTQLELPFRMMMTPFREDGAGIGLDHATGAVLGPNGSVGLWSSRVSAAGTAPSEPAGLTMRPLGVDSGDPFRTSLSGPSRARILAEEPTARIDRLRLSALGAAFSASGSWPTFEWDHYATMGRDHKVRTATQGVLYPFGHRAVYVESSERRLETTQEGAVAHLRKRSVLMVTEPVKDLPPSRAFPFTRVQMQRTLVELADDPPFGTKDFPNPAEADLFQTSLQMIGVANNLRPVIDGGDMGPAPGAPPVEDLAFFDGITSPEVAQAAREFLSTWAEVKRINEKIEALRAGGIAPVDLFLVPSDAAGTIRFPTVLSGPSGDVHVDLPVVFVADVRMPEGLLHPAYRSLEDADLHERVAVAYHDAGDGDVEVGPVRIDMVGAPDPKPADSPEVRRLHIVGEPREGGFGPRLGAAPVGGETVPPERWAFEMAMTELSTLVGHPTPGGAPSLRVALSTELLSGAPDPGLLFVAPEGVDALTAAFSRNSARSGGLAAPDLKVDGVARSQGPVQAATFLDQVQKVPLDPKKFLGEAANLMGFSLADLVDGAKVAGTPEILSDLRPGQPPKVTMRWPGVPLKTEDGPFLTSPDSQLDLEVTLAPDHRRVRCTVENVTIAFPKRDDPPKLLEVHLGKVEFLQEGGAAPTLHVSDVTTKFFGFLKLLEDLQDAVKLAGSSPAIHASDRGVTATFDLPVPDVTTGGFQLTGLSFHSVVDVPFDERPVSIELAFASREDPFNVSILALGGGGYVDIALDRGGLKRLEISLEFGANLEIDFVVASGEVHAMGGIRVVHDGGLALAGYLRFGGMVEILGLVSVSVELVVTLAYVEQSDTQTNAMVGRATLVLEVDLLLVSETVELDSGEWVLAGDATPAEEVLTRPPPGLVPGDDLGLDAGTPIGLLRAGSPVAGVDPEVWRAYRAAFDQEALS